MPRTYKKEGLRLSGNARPLAVAGLRAVHDVWQKLAPTFNRLTMHASMCIYIYMSRFLLIYSSVKTFCTMYT